MPPGFLTYSVAKAALEKFSTALAGELAPLGYRGQRAAPGRGEDGDGGARAGRRLRLDRLGGSGSRGPGRGVPRRADAPTASPAGSSTRRSSAPPGPSSLRPPARARRCARRRRSRRPGGPRAAAGTPRCARDRSERRELIRGGEELPACGIDTTQLADAGAQLVVGRTDHRAIGVLHHADPGDAEQVRREDQRAQRVVGHPRTRVADDLGVSGAAARAWPAGRCASRCTSARRALAPPSRQRPSRGTRFGSGDWRRPGRRTPRRRGARPASRGDGRRRDP